MTKMKTTGIPWLPEIADTFSVGYVKQYFYVSKDLSDEGEPERVLKLARAGIVEKDVTTNEGQMAASYAGYNKVKVGDLLLNPMDLYSGANCNVSELDGVISPAYSNLRAKQPGVVVPKFYDYYFKCQYWLMAMFAHGKGVSFDNRWTLNNDALRSYEIPVLPYELQQTIVARIQCEEKKVDSLIANVQAQIEKLKAYKQSLITEVVTKGLDPNVPMKDSGVDVYPYVPSHWNVQKTLTLLTMPITDGPHTTPELLPDGIPFVSAEAVSCGNGSIDFSHIRGYISQEFYDECCKKYIPQLNDIYMIKSGATTGRVSVVDTDKIFTIWSPLAVFRCNPGVVHYRFLYYFLQSTAYQRQVQFGWTYGTQQNIGMRTLERLKVFVPPIDEQNAIAEHLDAKCARVDSLITVKQSKIEKLEQYKKSLIYEYVTGKKEVQ